MSGELSGTTSTAPCPLAHQLELAEAGKRFDEPGDDEFVDRRIAALRKRRDAVDAAAEDEFALARLADAGSRAEDEHDAVERRLDGLADHRLQRVDVGGQLEPSLGGERRGVRSGGEPDPLGADRSRGGYHALADAALDQQVLDRAILDDVDAERVGRAAAAPQIGRLNRLLSSDCRRRS
jgi:hypothetical protein